MESYASGIIIILLLHNVFIEVCSHVIDATELPSNQWSTQSVSAFKNSNSESLEDELQSLNLTNPRPKSETEGSFFSLEEDDDTVESFDDELDDIGQQRERPSEESQEEDGSNDIIVTTLVPTFLTEEETRVDEPTENGPAEPTKENPASGSGVMSDGDTYLTTRPTVNEGKLSDEEDKLKEWKEKSQVLDAKEFKHDDYIDDEPDDDDDEDFFAERDSGDGSSKQQNSSEKIITRTKKELKEALYETGMFARTTRNARLYVNSPHEEDMLNFLIKLSKNPKGWARVTEILGKMDYDTSARLKTALQMEALNHQKAQKTINLLPTRDYYRAHVKENNVLKSHSYRATDNLKSGLPKSHFTPWDTENKERAKWHTTNSKIYNNAGKPSHSSFDIPLHDNDLRHLNQHHGPIDTIAVDVPGSSYYSNQNPKENKQAYIAVSIYKPTKQSYRKVDTGLKNINNLPLRFPSTMRPQLSANNNFGFDSIPAIAQSSSNLPHVSLNKNFGDTDIIPFHQQKPNGNFNPAKNNSKYGNNKTNNPKKLKNGEKNFRKKQKQQSPKKEKMKQKQKQKQKYQQQQPTDDIEAQLLALSKMEEKLKQQMIEKEKLRQSLRTRHRTARSSAM